MEKNAATKEIPTESVLQNIILHVVPNPVRYHAWLGKNHDGSFMFTGTEVGFQLPINPQTGNFIRVLTDEQEKFFEKKLALQPNELSIYNKKGYWSRKWVKLTKGETTLNLADADDYLKYLILKNQKKVSCDWEKRNSPAIWWLILDKSKEVEENVKEADMYSTAYEFLRKVEKSNDQMYDFLLAYWLESPKATKPSLNQSKDQYISQIQLIIKDDLKTLIHIIKDKQYNTKLLIGKAIVAGIYIKERGNYKTVEGVILGKLDEVVYYLDNVKNQEDRLRLINQLENSK